MNITWIFLDGFNVTFLSMFVRNGKESMKLSVSRVPLVVTMARFHPTVWVRKGWPRRTSETLTLVVGDTQFLRCLQTPLESDFKVAIYHILDTNNIIHLVVTYVP